jgi:hypothetical protein
MLWRVYVKGSVGNGFQSGYTIGACVPLLVKAVSLKKKSGIKNSFFFLLEGIIGGNSKERIILISNQYWLGWPWEAPVRLLFISGELQYTAGPLIYPAHIFIKQRYN